MAKTPLGRLHARAFGMLELPRLALPMHSANGRRVRLADEVGVCFVPFERAAEALKDWIKL